MMHEIRRGTRGVTSRAYDNLPHPAAFVSYKLSEWMENRRPITIEGEFPETGPALVAVNHTHPLDPILLALAAIRTANRMPIFVVRHTMLDPSAQEAPGVMERTGKRDFFNNTSTHILPARWALAQVLKLFDVIPVHRSNATRDELASIMGALNDEKLVVIFIQDTRLPENDLLGTQQGIAYIALKTGAPVVPAGISEITGGLFSRDPITLRIGESFTTEDMQIPSGLKPREQIRFVHDFILGRLAPLIPDHLKSTWLAREHGLRSEFV